MNIFNGWIARAVVVALLMGFSLYAAPVLMIALWVLVIGMLVAGLRAANVDVFRDMEARDGHRELGAPPQDAVTKSYVEETA